MNGLKHLLDVLINAEVDQELFNIHSKLVFEVKKISWPKTLQLLLMFQQLRHQEIEEILFYISPFPYFLLLLASIRDTIPSRGVFVLTPYGHPPAIKEKRLYRNC